MMSEDNINEISKPNQKTTISAWPKDNKTAKWDKKIDGVQNEPIGYWVGDSVSSAKNVYVLKMLKRVIKVKWKFILPIIYIVWEDANSSDANKAVNYANSKKKKPYSLTWGCLDTAFVFLGVTSMSKWWDDSYYCSQLVLRSWADVSLLYDFTALNPIVFPHEFLLADNTRVITHYFN